MKLDQSPMKAPGYKFVATITGCHYPEAYSTISDKDDKL